MSSEKVKAILDNENQAFRSACRRLYVECTKELGLSPNVDEAVVIVGSSSAKAYAQVSLAALKSHKSVLIAGKGSQLVKAVAVAEQVKQQESGPVTQFNKASLSSSLINPAYKPSASLKNIQTYLDDGELTQESTESQSSEQARNDVLREIHGHKVYQIASVAILLVEGSESSEGNLSKWTKQVKN